MPKYDMNDFDIREMVRHNHTPEESYNSSNYLINISCSMCHGSWPCEPIVDLREWEINRRAQLKTMTKTRKRKTDE